MKRTHFLFILISSLGFALPSKLIAMEGQEPDEPRKEEFADENSPTNLGKKLLDALEEKNKEEALRILQLNPDVTLPNDQGLQSIHLATLNGWTDVIDLLLKKGASLDAVARNLTDDRPIFLAAGAGDLETLSFLLLRGADVNTACLLRVRGDEPNTVKSVPINIMGHAAICAALKAFKSMSYYLEAKCLKSILKLLFKHGASFDEPSFWQSIRCVLMASRSITTENTAVKFIKMYTFLSSFLESMRPYVNFQLSVNDIMSIFMDKERVNTNKFYPYPDIFMLLSCFSTHNLLAKPHSIPNMSRINSAVNTGDVTNSLRISLSWENDTLTEIKFDSNPAWLLDERHCKMLLDWTASQGTVDLMTEIIKNSSIKVTQEMFASAFLCAAGSGRSENVQRLLENANITDYTNLWFNALNDGLYSAALREHHNVVKLILEFVITHDIPIDVRELGRMLYAMERRRLENGLQPNLNHRAIRGSLYEYTLRRHRISRSLLNGQPDEAQETETTLTGAVLRPTSFTQLPAEMRLIIHGYAGLGNSLYQL